MPSLDFSYTQFHAYMNAFLLPFLTAGHHSVYVTAGDCKPQGESGNGKIAGNLKDGH